jgi:hypothetical protein
VDREEINWFKRHVDTFVILGGILTSFVYMQGSISSMDKRLSLLESRASEIPCINQKLAEIEKKVTKIETILIMQGIMHPNLACTAHNNKVKIEEVKE